MTTINTENITACHPGSHKRIVRMRANKVRYQCSSCLKIGPWEKSQGYTNPTKPAHNFGPVVNLPGDKNFKLGTEADYNSMTVGDLRTIAKDKGMTGYSKMKKDDLIAALVNA